MAGRPRVSFASVKAPATNPNMKLGTSRSCRQVITVRPFTVRVPVSRPLPAARQPAGMATSRSSVARSDGPSTATIHWLVEKVV